jgi:hypothetical protein
LEKLTFRSATLASVIDARSRRHSKTLCGDFLVKNSAALANSILCDALAERLQFSDT